MDSMPKAFMNDPVFRDLNDVAQIAALPQKKRRNYERSLKTYRDMYSIMETERADGLAEGLKRGREEGLQKGLQKGREEGREECLQKGLQKGREEERIEMGRSLKTLGVDLNMIAEASGLTIDRIRSL